MDVSLKYIKMCNCPEIQVKHWEDGWEEGDYFWDGSKICLCGMDYLAVKQIFKDGRNYVRFAMREPMSCIVWEQKSPCSDISAKIGTYEIMTLYNAIWLPRQDQLQEMVDYPTAGYLIPVFANFIAHYPHSLFEASMEQLWLAFYMKEKGKVWEDGWVEGEIPPKG